MNSHEFHRGQGMRMHKFSFLALAEMTAYAFTLSTAAQHHQHMMTESAAAQADARPSRITSINSPFASTAPACLRIDRAGTNRLNPYTSASPTMSTHRPATTWNAPASGGALHRKHKGIDA
jgi:hypothetical protein